jgi:hypothetical protein
MMGGWERPRYELFVVSDHLLEVFDQIFRLTSLAEGAFESFLEFLQVFGI